ncbi:hypothetical protein [Sagittula sp. MA-2]|uniref:hypothetical protein n=1 Tax=Sagittula sp. MA-2 TaxID=3048007 RepID=UPI0024C20F8B|nr:hypothetical protein [Sagittula sp. MA-2]WHZ37718.1 hypothetical protein QNI11_22895 [Sagittula sp. MA-2]
MTSGTTEGTREALSMPSFDDLDDFAPRGGKRKSQEIDASRKAVEHGEPNDPAGQGGAVTGTVPDEAPRRKSRTLDATAEVRHVPSAAETRRAIDAVSHFPSREAATDGQLNLKGPRHVLDRFRAMCKADRRAYYDMLEILMDQFEGRTP